MQPAVSYWITLRHLARHPIQCVHDVDMPLETAVQRARWAVAWSVLCLWIAAAVGGRQSVDAFLDRMIHHHASGLFHAMFLVVLGLVAIPVGYGFFRLYTLVTHVLTLNVFQTRGQRLRLLTLQTSLLSMTAPLSVTLVVMHFSLVPGLVLSGLCILAIIAFMSVGYNQIFHKKGLGGLQLWIGGTLVTWFVLGIGALAITVMAAVLGFFVILILRSFSHHTA